MSTSGPTHVWIVRLVGRSKRHPEGDTWALWGVEGPAVTSSLTH